jgi:hypothetical protein
VRAVVAIAPVALLATSCGGKSTTPLGKAVAKTAAQVRYHVVMSVKLGRSGAVRSVGDYDGQVGSFEVSFEGRRVLKEIVNGSTLYMRSDSQLFANQAPLPAGKHWISIDLKLATPLFGQDASQTGLSWLGAARVLSTSKNVNVVARGGTHYTGTVPSPRAKPGKLQAHPLSVDVWIGKDGYVRQVRTTKTYKTPGFAALGTTTMYVLSRFGQRIQIQLPQVADTVDRTQHYAKTLTAIGGK